jgi:AcrR family transcriptional regulator
VVSNGDIDPRVARTRRDVLAAAREVFLAEGWERVTLAHVAEHSGYARTTLYRHWPQRLDLLRDLIGEEVRLLHATPVGDLRKDLLAEMEAFRAALTTSGLGRMMIAIAQQARDDRELADLSSAVLADGSQVLREIIAAGARGGELPVDLDPDVAVAQLVGPLLFRFLFQNELDGDGASVTSVVDWFLAGATGARGDGAAAQPSDGSTIRPVP